MLTQIVAYIVAYWEAMPEDVRITIGLAVIAALLLGIWWVWWRLPRREAARLALNDPKDRADVEDNYRKTVGQALGGVAVLLGAGLAYLQFSQQQLSSHDLLISNQVSKGFEQLGSEKVVIRLGGIYALEGVMNNSDQYYRSVLEALTAFVREGTSAAAGPMSTDIKAALTVIGRRSAGQGDVDLTKVNIAGANLAFTNLSAVDLAHANLSDAYLFGANLSIANLSDADLASADLSHADLASAYLAHANLSFANLTGANLSFANLTGANLKGVSLSRANLTGVNLDQKQLDEACGSDAVLPARLTLKPCPSQSWP